MSCWYSKQGTLQRELLFACPKLESHHVTLFFPCFCLHKSSSWHTLGGEENSITYFLFPNWVVWNKLELYKSFTFPFCKLSLLSLLGEGEDVEDEEQKGPELKQASRRDMYTICQTAGLGNDMFTFRPFGSRCITRIKLLLILETQASIRPFQ